MPENTADLPVGVPAKSTAQEYLKFISRVPWEPYLGEVTPEQIAFNGKIMADRDQTYIAKGFAWPEVCIFRDYAAGKHIIVLTDKQKQLMRNLMSDRFCDNVCGQIVEEAAGRVQFNGWETVNSDLKKFLDVLYQKAGLISKETLVHYETVRDGNFAVSLNWQRDKVQVYREQWWDGYGGTYIHYNWADEVDYACKEWIDTLSIVANGGVSPVTFRRRTVWFPDRLERWASMGGGYDWIPVCLPGEIANGGDGGMWPRKWVDNQGDPLGIPVVHFPNAKRNYGNYGVSELDGGVMGFQDQLNDLQYQLTMCARLTGAQQYWASGVRQPKDSSGNVMPINVDAGMFHTTENKDAKFGVLPAGDMDAVITAYEAKLKAVARMTGTPIHIITGGDWPSGEALLRSELPAVNKAKKQIKRFKFAWVEVAKKAIGIYNRFSEQEQIAYELEEGLIDCNFDDPEKRDAVSRSIIVHNMGGNISKKEANRVMGYSEEKADEIVEEIYEEARQDSEILLQAAAAGAGGRIAMGSSSSTGVASETVTTQPGSTEGAGGNNSAANVRKNGSNANNSNKK